MKKFRGLKSSPLALSLAVVLIIFCGLMSSSDQRNQRAVRAPQFVSAFPQPVDIVQPDKSTLTIIRSGDEVINYTRTTDGYTVLPDELGVYYYAQQDSKGDLVISSTKAENPGKRSGNKFLQSLKQNLEYSASQKNALKNKWGKKNKRTGVESAQWGPIDQAFPSTGTRKMLVILSAFSDKSFVKTNTDFNNLMNVGSGSFKQYYLDNSYNALTVNTTVVGPYTINMTMSAADSNTQDYIARCVDAANNAGVDFSQFDNNSDGKMDALYVIHAGYGEEAGAPTNTIWSHSWEMGSYARNYDGVSINSYATSPELRGASGSNITSIGVIAHEFGHNMGVPDYYDTDGTGSGGSAWDLKSWDVMAGGSWNNSGDTPAQHCMYTKWQLGWSNPTILSSATTITGMGNTKDYNLAYRINTTTNNEFFILENRQKVGWDAYLPGSGLLIFHVDHASILNLSGNTVNANPSKQLLDIEEADNLRSTSDYAGDPFPGSANKTSFTDTTTPNAKSWAGANTGKPVTSISASGGNISFDFMGGSSTPTVTANFTFTVSGLTATFTDTSTASGTTITNWSWNFGDSTTSTSQNPSHTYTAAGTYNVTLTVSDNASHSNSITKSVTVTSGGVSYCTASGNNSSYEWIAGVAVGALNKTSGAAGYSDFTATSATLNKGASVNVTLTPGFSSSTYNESWKIWIDYNKDGDFADTGEEVFAKAGSAAVTGSFTVSSSASTGTTRMRVIMRYNTAPTSCGTFDYGEVEDYTVDIQAGTVTPPVANFTASATTITVGQSVTFTDTSSNGPTSWSWSFPGGTPSTSTQQNPVVTYNTAGTYNVTLTATNSAGSDDEAKTSYITVQSQQVTYCTAASTNYSYEYIKRVQMAGLDKTSTGSTYSNFTASSASAAKGASVSFTLTPGFASSSYNEYFRIYIDFNRDGDFADAGETVFSGYNSAAVSGSFTVPSTALTGATRMRITMQYNSYAASCGSFTYGEVEDYTFNVQ